MFCGHCMDEPCSCSPNIIPTIKGKINNWRAVWDNKDLDVHFHICGEMNNSPISTSRVNKIEKNLAYTRNNIYELGFPDTWMYDIV